VQTLLIAWRSAPCWRAWSVRYPWRWAPLLIAFGIADLPRSGFAALANKAPVSSCPRGADHRAGRVTGLPLNNCPRPSGKIVAVLALAPPWILIYLSPAARVPRRLPLAHRRVAWLHRGSCGPRIPRPVPAGRDRLAGLLRSAVTC